MLFIAARIYALVSFLQREEEIESDKHFNFGYQVNLLTLVQSSCFLVISVVIFRMASKSIFIFKHEHYSLMFKILILAFGLLFFVPLAGIFALSYLHGSGEGY